MANDLGDAVERDPEVRQARTVAEAARARLVACLSNQEDGIDLAEAQGMLEAFKNARTLAENAEDRVLLHRGLLTPAEADNRAAKRCPAAARSDKPARPTARRDLRASRVFPLRVPVAVRHPSGQLTVARVIAGALGLAVLVVGVILAQRGVRPRPAHR